MAFDRTTKDEHAFTALTDTPTTITASNYVRGNTGGSDLEFRTSANVLSDVSAVTAVTSWSGNHRSALLTDDDGSFDLSAKQNFFCSPGADKALTFTSPADGQSGFVKLYNAADYAHTAPGTTKINSDDLSAISKAGTFLLGYLSDGTNTWVTVSKKLD